MAGEVQTPAQELRVLNMAGIGGAGGGFFFAAASGAAGVLTVWEIGISRIDSDLVDWQGDYVTAATMGEALELAATKKGYYRNTRVRRAE